MANGTCIADGCGRTGEVKRGWCLSHYMRWHRHGDVQSHIPIKPPLPPGSSCTINGCERRHFSNSFCSAHWSRWRQHGDPLAHVPIWEPTPRGPTCAVDECERQPLSRGWCGRHYMRWWLHGDPVRRDGRLRAEDAPVNCSVEACGRPVQSLGWCRTHYSRWQRRGDIWEHLPIRRYRWTGEICSNDGCTKKVRIRGRCKAHYARVLSSEIEADPVRLAARREASRRSKALEFAANPGRVRARARNWRARNPDAARLHYQRRWQRRNAAPVLPFTHKQLEQRMAYWGNRCWMCGGPFQAVDHVKPISKGGAHALMNLRPACKSDNSSKRDKWPYPTRTTLRPIPLP